MTLTEAIAAWKTANPIGSINPPVSATDYDVMAADRGQMWLDQVTAQDDAATRAQRVQQFIAGRSKLQADSDVVKAAIAATPPTTLSPAQIRKGFDDVLDALLWLSDRIADKTIVIRE